MELFDVIEVEIAAPHSTRLMASGLTDENAEAFVKMAVIRRGVKTHFYRVVTAYTVKPQT